MKQQIRILWTVCAVEACAIFIYTIEKQLFPSWTPTQLSLAIQIMGYIFCIGFIKEFGIRPLECFKVRPGTGRKTLLGCICILLVCIAGSIAVRQVMNIFSAEVAARPFFGLYLRYNRRYIYPFFIVLQQCFSKAVVLDTLTRYFNTVPFWKINILSCLFFATLHLGYDIWFMLGAIGLLFVTNIFYRKDGNIYSSVILHFGCGFVAPMFGIIGYL